MSQITVFHYKDANFFPQSQITLLLTYSTHTHIAHVTVTGQK